MVVVAALIMLSIKDGVEVAVVVAVVEASSSVTTSGVVEASSSVVVAVVVATIVPGVEVKEMRRVAVMRVSSMVP